MLGVWDAKVSMWGSFEHVADTCTLAIQQPKNLPACLTKRLAQRVVSPSRRATGQAKKPICGYRFL